MKKQNLKPLLLMLAMLCMSIGASAYDFKVDGICYNISSSSDKTCEVIYETTSYNSYSGSVEIPSSVTYNSVEYKVTSIGSNAFYGCSDLMAVNIPNSVTSIGSLAFHSCSGLTIVNIPNSCTSIGNSAFYECSGLTAVNIPNSLTSIGNSAFYGCSGLTAVNIPNSLTSIGEWAFGGCKGLTAVNIPNSCTSIGERAFGYCSGLTSFVVDTNNPSYCSVNNILFNKDKTELILCIASYSGAVNIPNSVTSIEGGAFWGCKGLTSVNIPNSVTSIGEGAFLGCSDLTAVTIPNSVTSIGVGAFDGCSGLTAVNIPNSVTSIGNYAFLGCNNISTLHYNSNCRYTLFCKELYIGDDVSIVYSDFSSSELQKVVLGKNVAYLRQDAFSYANIKEFTITGEEPPYCYPNVFGTNDLSEATLYVPESKAEYYQTTEPWTKFGKVLTLSGEEPSGPVQCATPTITYTGEKITFACATEGASIHYTITPTDKKSGVITPGDVEITGLYDVTAYATAEGKMLSETASKQIKCAVGTVEVEKIVEVHDTIYVYDDTRSEIKLPTGETMTLYIIDGVVNIENAPLNSLISIYTLNGELYETLRVKKETIAIDLPRNAIYIIKVGEKTFKVKI